MHRSSIVGVREGVTCCLHLSPQACCPYQNDGRTALLQLVWLQVLLCVQDLSCTLVGKLKYALEAAHRHRGCLS